MSHSGEDALPLDLAAPAAPGAGNVFTYYTPSERPRTYDAQPKHCDLGAEPSSTEGVADAARSVPAGSVAGDGRRGCACLPGAA